MIIGIFILLSLTFINLYLYRDIMHPTPIFCLLWLMQLIGVYFFHQIYTPLSLTVISIVILGVISFSLGGWFGSFFNRINIKSERVFNQSNIFFSILFLICVYSFFAKVNIVFDQPGDSLARKMIGLRVRESIDNEDVFGIHKYFSTLSIALLLFVALVRKKINTSKLIKFLYPVLFTICFLSSFFSSGRLPIIILVVMLSLVAILNYNNTNKALFISASTSIPIVVGIFWGVGIIYGKVDNTFNDLLYNFTTYIFSGLPALDSYIHSPEFMNRPLSLGEHTFRLIQAIGSKIGIVEPPAPLVQEFVQVPHYTNLYTIFHIYIKDFSYIGVFIFLFLIGMGHSLIYIIYKKNITNEFIKYFLILSYIPLVQVIFQETYFSLLSTWVQFIMLAFILTIPNRGGHA